MPRHRARWVATGARVCGLAIWACTQLPAVHAADTPLQGAPDTARYRAWVQSMKDNPRGPFDQIRWFCKDGTRLPPTPSACAPYGGGAQHGQWSAHTLELRKVGYRIANIYADLDPDDALGDPTFATLGQMLVEQFLVRADDGWILRHARFYRGAFQEEGERKGARALLLRMLADPAWPAQRFLLLRSAVAALPHGIETPSVREIRQLSATLSDRDPPFKPVRNKIHGRMGPEDARAVREYAAGLAGSSADYVRLADLIDALYARDTAAALRALRERVSPGTAIAQTLDAVLPAWQPPLAADPMRRIPAVARLLATLREGLQEAATPALRLQMLDASLALDAELFTDLGAWMATAETLGRRARLEALDVGIDALYGTGLLSPRERDAVRGEIRRFLTTSPPTGADYKRTADYLALIPQWATRRYHLHFGLALETLLRIEPKAALFVQDALRGSPLFFYASLTDSLVRDANRVTGVRNELFGAQTGGGLRGLNPGLAHGVLHFAEEGASAATFDRDGIYVLPETVADLPPVAGIVTAGEGNPLSHVQLLARNLGIPNVAVEARLLEQLRPYAGREIVLAVSPGGAVRIAGIDPETRARLWSDPAPATRATITVDPAKLDLARTDFLDLATLRGSDSGRIVGPKAAKLGELKQRYPEAVADGVAIPFGVFRAALDQPLEGSISIFDWMKQEYARLATLPADSTQRHDDTEAFRARLENAVASVDPGPAFRTGLRAKLLEVFGDADRVGVFVRSDTNVEDLPGFTGAGLNLTLPNVVGFEALVNAIPKVWASPFTARSFAWRQSLMTTPEHVYPAVLLLRSVDNDKSGVLVTHDIDSGDPDWLSVAVNEGVGGAVDGQSAESVRIHVPTGRIRLLAQASAPLRRQISPRGGIALLPVSGRDFVLEPEEATQLVTLARELPSRFEPIVDAEGQPAPADIEFGFRQGQLQLFQIRPFLDNNAAQDAGYLTAMDAHRAAQEAALDLEVVP
ncbi:MAG: PEP/pyruvate-binding domain-containing protein [Gammaproteobacteria bacterium]